MRFVSHFVRNEDGPTAVEYAVMLACIIVVLIASIMSVGGQTLNFWSSSKTNLDNAFAGS